MERNLTKPWRRRVAALAVAVAAVVATLGAVFADGAAAQVQVEAQVRLSLPGAAPGTPGTLVAVDVQVSTPRAERATLIVSSRSFDGAPTQVSYSVPLELAAATPVTFSLSVPSGFDGVNLDASLLVDGVEVADAELRRFPDRASSLVGLLGIDGPDRVSLSVGTGTAVTFEVTPQRLETAGLPGAAVVVASSSALRDLPEVSRDVVLAFVAGGGELIVVGRSGSIDEVLPPQWRDDPSRAGTGRIVYAENDWEGHVVPSGALSVSGGPENDPFVVVGDVPTDAISDLARDAGLRLPSLRTLAILLLVYIAVAGPIVYLVLKRAGRTHLAWVVLPVVAVVFSLGSLVVGSDLRSDRGNSHVTIVEVWPQGSRATTSALLTSSRSATRSITLPAGWSYTGTGTLFGPGPTSGSAVTIEPSRNGTRFSSELPAGGAVTAQFAGPAPSFDGALEISGLVWDGDSVAGTVSNRSGADLTETLAFFGTAVVEIGALDDGATVPFSIEFSSTSRQRLREFAVWPTQRFFGDRQPTVETATSSGVWAQWRAIQGWNTFPDGQVGVVGWTRDMEAPSGGVSLGRTALVARAPLPAPSSAGAPLNRTVVLDPGSQGGEFGGDQFFFTRRFAMRFDVPTQIASESLVLEVRRDVAGLEVWVGDDWVPLELEEGSSDDLGVDPAWIVDGSLWVRSSLPEWVWPARPAVHAMLGTADIPDTREVGDVISRGGDGFPFEEGFGGFEAELSETIDVEIEPGETVEYSGDLFGPEYDDYVVTLDESDEITVRLVARHDSLLRVRNADGRNIAENDDFGQCCNSGLTFTASVAGEYVIEARELGNNGQGEYELSIQRGESTP